MIAIDQISAEDLLRFLATAIICKHQWIYLAMQGRYLINIIEGACLRPFHLFVIHNSLMIRVSNSL